MEIDYAKLTEKLAESAEAICGTALKTAGFAGKTALKLTAKGLNACSDKIAAAVKNADKKDLAIAAGVAAAAVAVPLWMIAPGHITAEQKKPFLGRNFAHRGLHTEDKSVPENSLQAFDLACRAGYGIELDVQLSKDGQVVVFHDDDLKRVCGVDSPVCEKTYDELHAMSLCGTDQTIPLFTDVLKVVDGRGPLIVELKTGKRNRELCKKTLAILREYKGEYCIESFDPSIVMWFRFHARDIVRGQLSMARKEYQAEHMAKPLPFILSRTLLNFTCRPQFIAYQLVKMPLTCRIACRLGAMNVAWTSLDAKNEKGKDAVIFQFYRPKQKYL